MTWQDEAQKLLLGELDKAQKLNQKFMEDQFEKAQKFKQTAKIYESEYAELLGKHEELKRKYENMTKFLMVRENMLEDMLNSGSLSDEIKLNIEGTLHPCCRNCLYDAIPDDEKQIRKRQREISLWFDAD